MPHNNNINQDHTFVLYGTEIPYTGRVIQIGDKYFTTQGGGIEGDREEVTIVLPTEGNIGNQLSTINSQSLSGTGNASGDNPITDLFVRGDGGQFDRVYYYSNGNLVPNGTPLHRHQDGTIMTQHTMGPNDNSVVVTTTQPQTRGTGTPRNGMTRQGNQGAPPSQTGGGTGGGGGTY